MQLSLVITKSGLEVVSQTTQLDYEPSCHMVNPCTISGTTKITLKRWPAHTDDEHILLRSEDLLTVCEPSEKLAEAYMKKFKLTAEDFEEALTEGQEPVMLNEHQEPQLPDIESVPDFEDGYEPRYEEY